MLYACPKIERFKSDKCLSLIRQLMKKGRFNVVQIDKILKKFE